MTRLQSSAQPKAIVLPVIKRKKHTKNTKSFEWTRGFANMVSKDNEKLHSSKKKFFDKPLVRRSYKSGQVSPKRESLSPEPM